MRFGLSTFLWSPKFRAADLPLLEHARSLGADFVEIQRSGFDDFPVAEVRWELDRLNLACALSASPTTPEISIIADDAGHRQAGIAYLRTSIRVARDLGAEFICGPVYAPPWWFTGSRATDEQRAWAADGLAQLSDDLAAAGIFMAIEPLNRFETFFLNTTDEGIALCEAVGSAHIGLLLDNAHMAAEEKHMIAAVRRASPWLRHLQLPETDRGTPGTGSTDWSGLFETLIDIGYQGDCSIESFPFPAPHLAMMTRTWRDLAPSSDTLAREGLLFLRRCHAAALGTRSS